MFRAVAPEGAPSYTQPMGTKPDDRLHELILRSGKLLESGEAERALAVADEACEFAPRSATARCARAESLIALERDDEALDAYGEALDLDKDDIDALWGAADLLIHQTADDEAAMEEGLQLCRRGIRVAKKLDEEEIVAELQLLEAAGLSALGDPASALERIDSARRVLGDDPEVLLERGATLFELCRFDEAAAELERVLRDDPDAAWAHHTLGLVHEHRGNQEAAESRFAKARSIAPEDFPEPVRLSEDEFDRAVEEALTDLPEQVRTYLSNVAIAVEPIPRIEELQGPDPLSPSTLGVFRGSPRKDQSTFDPWSYFPNSIVLYQRNLERFASSREELIDEIEVTLLHEVGHFLGFDEDDLRARDLD